MDYLTQIQKGIDFIETHLEEDISLSQVADAANISQWHFQRIFKALSNETLKAYIRARRLANARDRLVDSDTRIIDIALASGYDTQESFSRAFKKMFELSPNEYRKVGKDIPFVKKLAIDRAYLEHLKSHISLAPEITQQAAMTLVGLKTRFYGSASEKNNLAEKLPPLWAEFLARLGEIPDCVPGACYGVLYQAQQQSDLLEYYAAIEVSRVTELPQGMQSITIPASTYARFCHRGDPRLLDNTVNYIYANWLLNSGHRHSYAADLEIYGEGYIAESEESQMHYAIPIFEG